MYSTQVSREHYEFLEYLDENRWCSYYKQIEEIFNSKAKSVLLIGVGDGIVSNVISKICDNVEIVTFDFANDLEPDICGDVRNLSYYFKVGYDAIVCCQVLEHLPFEEFDNVLFQISKCLSENGRLILSLPDGGAKMRFLLHIPGFHDIKLVYKIPQIWKSDFKFNGEHYWEINSARMYTAKKIRRKIKKYFKIEREYLVENFPYHRFYIASSQK